MLLAEQALDSVLIDIRLRADDFYRAAPPAHLRGDAPAEGEGRSGGGRRRSRCRDELAPRRRARGGRRHAVRPLAAERGARGRQRPPLRAASSSEHSLLRRLLGTTREVQEDVYTSSGDAHELIEQAEGKLFEIAHEDSTGELRLDRGRAPRRDRQARAAVAPGHLAHRHPVRLQGHRRPHRRLPAGQPDRAGGAPVDGQDPRSSRTSPRTPPSTTTARWRCSRSRCPRPSWRSASSPRRRS